MSLDCVAPFMDITDDIDICVAEFDDIRVPGLGEDFTYALMYDGQVVEYDGYFVVSLGEA